MNIYYARDAEIRQRAEKESCAAIARDLGLTRERVRQIVGQVDRCPEGYVSTKEYSARAGIRRGSIRRLVSADKVVSVKLGKYRFIKFDDVARPCGMCGIERGSRIRYCESCAVIAEKKAVVRSSFRRFYRQKGQLLPLCLAYMERRKESYGNT